MQQQRSSVMDIDIPDPGSDEAILAGCICPVYDNHHGAGCYDDGEHYWVTPTCPLHGKKRRGRS